MDAVEEIKARLGIEDVISEYVQLKRAGRNWKGLSPFTSEKTPSFMVSPEKQIWHDFSSGKGGDMFSFVMEMDGLDFKGALEVLARKAGVDLEQYQRVAGRGGPNKERLYQLLELAAKFYQVQFSRQPKALTYVLEKRHFSKETALAWRLGYSPNTGTALIEFLTKQGYTALEMQQAGVTAGRYGTPRDMFRGRLMIPLADTQGRIIGFTARLLEDEPNAPKYINTPATVLYDKSRHIFGLHLAKQTIRQTKFVVLVEGNMDVIASHQAGVAQTVAVAGTALTEQQLKALSRFTGDIRLSFDADRAGVAATERAIPIASKVGVSLSIIEIPSGKDPDELIRQEPALWQAAITQHLYALDWLMERYGRLLDLSSAQGKRQFSDILLPIVHRLSDPVEQDHYLTAIASVTDTSREALTAKLDTAGEAARTALRKPKVPPAAISDKQTREYARVQDHLLALTLLQPGLRGYLKKITTDMLTNDDRKSLLNLLQTHSDLSGDTKAEANLLRPIAEYVKILGLQYEELYQDLDATELHNEAERLREQLVKLYVKQQKQQIAAQLETVDEAAMDALLKQVKRLDRLLHQTKGGT